MQKCFVYVMECQAPVRFKPIKIGISNNPLRRIESIQNGNPWPIKLLIQIPMDSRLQAKDLENHLHKRFKKQRMNGEWFSQKGVNLKLAIERYQSTVKVDEMHHENLYGSKAKTKQVNQDIESELDSKIDLSWI